MNRDAALPNLPPSDAVVAFRYIFNRVPARPGEGFMAHKQLLWGVLGKADLSQTPWAKFDEVWS